MPNLPTKNTLTAADARLVEEAFRARTSSLVDRQDDKTRSSRTAIPYDLARLLCKMTVPLVQQPTEATPGAQQAAPRFRQLAAMPRLRTAAIGCTPSSVHSAHRAGAQGER